VPVKLWVKSQSCKCEKIEVAIFPGAPKQATSEEAVVRQQGEPLKWEVLHRDDKSVANNSVTVGPQMAGLLRLGWEGKQVGPARHTAELWTQAVTSPARGTSKVDLEVTVIILEPVLFGPRQETVGDLSARAVREGVFWCWSATRPGFKLTAETIGRDRQRDPCFDTTVRPMTEEERVQLATLQKTRVLSGYRITVQVHERKSDKEQMDLGPFRRKVLLTTDTGLEPEGPILTGTVRGDASVRTPEGTDKIELGHFRAEAGKKKQAVVETEAGFEVLTTGFAVEPEYLQVSVKPERAATANRGGTWFLHVEVPPGQASGLLPAASAIYLQLQRLKGDDQPRRIRIPVSGNAFH